MADTNSENPNGLNINEILDRIAALGSDGETTRIAGGFGADYKAPTRQGIVPFEGLHPGGSMGTTTVFGTRPHEGMYTRDDAWLLPYEDPDQIPQLQLQLVQAGLLNPKQVREGLWDEASANAYANVLGFANAYGLSASDALTALVNNPDAGALKGLSLIHI